jgi:hypothetical protein
MKITMDKKYRTRDGASVRVLCLDIDISTQPVLAYCRGEIEYYTTDGRLLINGKESPLDLVEVSPYDHIKKGDPVLVGNIDSPGYVKSIRIFFGITDGGLIDARISPESTDPSISVWDTCELYVNPFTEVTDE